MSTNATESTATPRPVRPTRVNGRASREAILAAALEVFAERGYGATTMAEVARRVGLTQPALLYHFASKDELLLAVIRQRETGLVDWLREDVPADGISKMARENVANPLLCLLFSTLGVEAIRQDHPAHEYFVERYRRIITHLSDQFRAIGVPRRDAELLAGEVIATLDGLHQQWLLDPERVDLAKSCRTYERRLRSILHDLVAGRTAR